jgi:predicted GNAT family N-acyltransferase
MGIRLGIRQPPMNVRVSQTSADAILHLRHRILRPGLPLTTAEFDGDHDPGTLHFGAAAGDEVICCLSLYRSPWKGSMAWQLRGMATDTAFRGQGIGRRLLDYAVGEAMALQPSWSIWCNARVPAVGFYRRAGWMVESEEFEIAGVGPHVRMVCPTSRTSVGGTARL